VAISKLKAGDTLVVWKLDRIARSLPDLLGIIQRLKDQGAKIKSLTEPIDTSNPIGEFTLQVLGAVAQLERSMIRERVIAGQVAAMKRGVVIGGRPRKLNTKQIAEAKRLRDRGLTWPAIGDRLGVSNTTARRAVLGDHRDRMVVLRQYL
jgi:DNA invertase Pin-like site-specific DNA recombinase